MPRKFRCTDYIDNQHEHIYQQFYPFEENLKITYSCLQNYTEFSDYYYRLAATTVCQQQHHAFHQYHHHLGRLFHQKSQYLNVQQTKTTVQSFSMKQIFQNNYSVSNKLCPAFPHVVSNSFVFPVNEIFQIFD